MDAQPYGCDTLHRMTRLLVLGGTAFVGRAIVDDALARGWEVTTFNRGITGAGADDDPRITRLAGDRTDPRALRRLAGADWDVVADTWSGAPVAVRDAARTLASRCGPYAYISSASVYAPPPPVGVTEATPTVAASPDAAGGDYPECKRGAELAVVAELGESRALLARPGLILGPHEDVGRLPWWLSRMARGGEVLAPGPPGRPLQLIDARDLAAFVLDAAAAGRSGSFNTVSRRGHATIGTLLESCLREAGAPQTRLTWVDPDLIERVGIEPWTELPIWLPPDHEYEALHGANVERAHAAGLRCRPVQETVADTWAWMRSLDGPPALAPDRPAPGLSAEAERAALAAARRS
jgi:2'-hydroxyisoflavone reductase